MDPLLREFLEEAEAHLAAAAGAVARLQGRPADRGQALALLRLLHTLKGTSSFLPLPRVTALAHAAEGPLVPAGTAAVSDTSLARIAAAIARLCAILDGVGRSGAEPEGCDADLIAALSGAAGASPSPEEGPAPDRLPALAGPAEPAPPSAHRRARHGADPIAPLPAQLETVGRAYGPLPRLVQHLESVLAKPLDLVLEGAEVEVERRTGSALRHALPHLVRNAADHGIEPAAERKAAGKPPRGRITVRARREAGGAVTVVVADDGRGLDPAAIAGKAGHGSGPRPHRIGMEEAARLVLRPGFTTAPYPTAISGRGIGLDAVRALVEEAGGALALRSRPGRGTTCTLRLPCPVSLPLLPAGALRPALPLL